MAPVLAYGYGGCAAGGACPDVTLQALLAAGRVTANDGTTGDAQALLLSDSSPQGGRAALAPTGSLCAAS